MVAFVDARVIKNTYKGGDFHYVVEVGYEEDVFPLEGEPEKVIRWSEHSSISMNNKFNTLDSAQRYQLSLLNQILVKSEVIE